jgi:hypothetical protein
MASNERDKMSALAIEEKARSWVMQLQEREKKRTGANKPDVRRVVADEIGVVPGTLENIERRRRKGISTTVFERIRTAFLLETANEIRRLENERQIALQIGLDARCNEVAEIEADLAALRQMAGDPDSAVD